MKVAISGVIRVITQHIRQKSVVAWNFVKKKPNIDMILGYAKQILDIVFVIISILLLLHGK